MVHGYLDSELAGLVMLDSYREKLPNLPMCCAGVQLNLANPCDPTDVRVLVDGTLHPANQVTRNGSFLYIMGLQAGTEYPLNITLSNIFRTVWINTTVRPLLGEQLVWAI